LDEFVRKWKRSGRYDNGNLRIVDLDLLEKFNAVEERHTIVGDHRIEMSFVQFVQGGITIAGRDHGISRMFQQCSQEKSRMMVVVHNEDPFAVAIHHEPPPISL